MPKKSRKQILRDAKRFLRTSWIKGKWVVFPDVGEWNPNAGMKSLQKLIADAKKKKANPECNVCAEGAVFLACALDGDEDNSRARILIAELNKRSKKLDSEKRRTMIVNDDGRTKLEDVISIFDRTESEIVDA
jgi:hypothetical protein